MNIDEIIKKNLGMDSYVKGKRYKRNYLRFIKQQNLSNNLKSFYFYVESESSYNYYDVEILIENNKIVKRTCDCPKFDQTNTCKHVAACVYNFKDILFAEESNKEDVSLSILKQYLDDSKTGIKKQLNLEIDLDFTGDKVKYKLRIGENKLYVINTSLKLNQLTNAYTENEPFELTNNFTYNPQIHYFSDQDKKILDFIMDYEKNSSYSYYYEKNDPFELNTRETISLLNILKDKPFTINNTNNVSNVINELPTKILLNKNKDTYILSIDDYSNYTFLDEDKKYVYYNNILYILPTQYQKLIKSLKDNYIEEISFNKKDFSIFKDGLLKYIKDDININDNIENIVINTKPEPLIYLDLYDNEIICHLKFKYKNTELDYFASDESILKDEIYESSILNEILNYDFIIYEQEIIMTDFDSICEFIENGLNELSKKYTIYTNKKLEKCKVITESDISSSFSIGKDGILTYSFDTEKINKEEIEDILSSLRNNKKYYKLKDGNIINLEQDANLQEFDNLLKDLDITKVDSSSKSIIIPKYRALYIDSLKKNKFKSIKTDLSFNNFIKNFNNYKNTNIVLNNNPLRSYQKEGVKWLYTIYKCDLGGILADEMGLGKSIQTIYFIKEILKEKPDAKIIIVSPTSLVYNWQKEFEKFAPDLNYIAVAENKEKRLKIISDFDKYNIFITSYGLIRNDNDEYENKSFEVCIIDEAQTIKNYQAGLTKEIKKIKARTKIALTGTPIENSVTELWSIFDFIMPGYFGPLIKFKEKYGIKDVTKDSLDKLKTLNYQIKPFILRRKKKEVSKDLPDKLENNIYVDFTKEQKELYISLLEDTKEKMDKLIKEEGYQSSRLQILQLLLRLRQVCINPKLLYDNYKYDSIKTSKLLDIINDYKLDNHKILIFSSFKTALDLLKPELDKNNISYYSIDGTVSGKDRVSLVDKFNSDDTDCFLITLKSGGTGLNLTSADVVIHLDIWWNPQAENQATDRAHRIGQKNNVTVIKLIVKGTIEEKILELQDKKKILSDNIIEGNSKEVLSSLTEEEMKKLLSYQEE